MKCSIRSFIVALALSLSFLSYAAEADQNNTNSKKIGAGIGAIATAGIGVKASQYAWRLAQWAYYGTQLLGKTVTMPASQAAYDMAQQSNNASQATVNMVGGAAIDTGANFIAGLGTLSASSCSILAGLVAAASFYGCYRCVKYLVNGAATE